MGLFPGVERQFVITLDGLKFAGEYPLPRDTRQIDVEVAQNLGGVPLHSVPQDTYFYERTCAELQHVIKDYPEELRDTQFIDYPDPEFIVNLFNEYRKKRDSWIKGLKKNQQPSSPKRAPSKNEPSPEPVSNADVQDTASRVS
ncbi:hypothetical protein [Leptospira sp. GIMC2001]|uniref:hypothetical protein n=1 Tax=Leptospira sp. GIMC2001 TaxID=1513297 RepID=UPI002349F29C|nr:hypothetical protein [Leptospira sp. GIMC2001]WCL51522.1 hypothetical protein O4O04_20105 [Leptospira sp. GIMC2001]